MAKIQEPALAALESIAGFGKAKTEKYGVDIMALLHQYALEQPANDNSPKTANQDETTGYTPF